MAEHTSTAEIDGKVDGELDGGVDVDGTAAAEPLVEADLLVEDVSIDGMCGVY